MDGKLPDIGFDTDNSPGICAREKSNNNSFELVLVVQNKMNMKDETERWQFMMSALKKVAQN